jgi:hypothetical protein
LSKDKSFSILYADGEKGNEVSLDLMAPTPVIFKYWFKGIKKILERIQDVRANSSPDDLFIKQTWENAGRDRKRCLTVRSIWTMAFDVTSLKYGLLSLPSILHPRSAFAFQIKITMVSCPSTKLESWSLS